MLLVVTGGLPAPQVRRAGRWKGRGRLIAAGLLLGLLGAMALVPSLFTDADPRACSLSRSLVPPSGEHPFGFDLQGCDYLAYMFETTEHRVTKAGYPPGTAGRVRTERVERERLERRAPYRRDGAGSFD